jgi:acyl-CoA synthetase (AMP-forming)/AMP-acid ligase II
MREAFSGASFGNGYGMTETCSMVTYIGGDAILDHVDSVGRPLPITDMRIVDPETGRDVAPGEPGELWFRGPQISLGYWRNEEATAKLFEDGWLKTGDAGSAGDDGYVVLRDRLKDVIKRSGESIYCFEVEDALHQHPAVLEAAVVGIPDEVYGERVAAVVATKPGAEAAGDELTAFCRDRLARFKVPERVAFVDALPRNAGGKVLKAELRTLVTTESDPRQGKEKVS